MEFDLMTGSSTWGEAAELAQAVEGAGFSGMLYTETGQVPWMQLAAAAMAAPSLTFTTGIAVAFPRSPMVSAQLAWELAGETRGRFRLGLGSQVKGHVVRRYSSEFDRPAARMRDYVLAVKACLRAFRRDEKLSHEGEFFNLSLLPAQWMPRRHDYGDVKVDISSVGADHEPGGGRGGRRGCMSTRCTRCTTSASGCCPRWPRAPSGPAVMSPSLT